MGNAGTANTEVGGVPSREALAEVLRSVAADAPSSDPGRLLSEAVAGGLLITEGVVGCSLTEIEAGRFRTPVYAGEAAIVLDLVQYAAGRGPCLTAIRHGQMYLTDDSAELTQSLPGWREQAARHGVGSVLSVPLPGTQPAAGLNFYGRVLGVFRPAVVSARARLVGRAVTAVHTRSTSLAQQTVPEDAAPNCSPSPAHARCWPRPALLSPVPATSPILKPSPASPSDRRAKGAVSWPWLAMSWRAQTGSSAGSHRHEHATPGL